MSKHNVIKMMIFETGASQRGVDALNQLKGKNITYRYLDPLNGVYKPPDSKDIKVYQAPDTTKGEEHAFRVGREVLLAQRKYEHSGDVRLEVVIVNMPSTERAPLKTRKERQEQSDKYSNFGSIHRRKSQLSETKIRNNQQLNIIRAVMDAETKKGAVAGVNFSYGFLGEGYETQGDYTRRGFDVRNDVRDHLNVMFTKGRKKWGNVSVAVADFNQKYPNEKDGSSGLYRHGSGFYETPEAVATYKEKIPSVFISSTASKHSSAKDTPVITAPYFKQSTRKGNSFRSPHNLTSMLLRFGSNAIRNGSLTGTQIPLAFLKTQYEFIKENNTFSYSSSAAYWKKFDGAMNRITVNKDKPKRLVNFESQNFNVSALSVDIKTNIK